MTNPKSILSSFTEQDPDYFKPAKPIFKFALRSDLENNQIFLPAKSEPLATGWDVRCAEPDGVKILPGDYAKIRLGFRSFCPPGWGYELHPRSSSFAKKYLHCLIGIIDESWEGETMLAVHFLPPKWPDISSAPLNIEFGEKIGQIIPVKKDEISVELVSNEEYNKLIENRNASRKDGGFGSTG